MPRRPATEHIVTYLCECCHATESRVGASGDGMCTRCGWPMRIERLFTDRRVVTLPVDVERRAAAAA